MQEAQILKMLTAFDSDLEWFKENLTSLRKNYDQNYVAIENAEVIMHDKNIDNLITKLKQLGKDPSKIFIQFVSKVKAIF